jgi:hypothetical protein
MLMVTSRGEGGGVNSKMLTFADMGGGGVGSEVNFVLTYFLNEPLIEIRQRRKYRIPEISEYTLALFFRGGRRTTKGYVVRCYLR